MNKHPKRHSMLPSLVMPNRHLGYGLFELIVVVIVIAILSMVALKKYQSSVKGSQHAVVVSQADSFLRSIDRIRALASLRKTSAVELDDNLIVYVNKKGWPIATNRISEKYQYSASRQGCESLMFGLFRDAKIKDIGENNYSSHNFTTKLIDGYICRYIFSRKHEGLFFFDYDIRTGGVNTFSP